MAAPLALAGDHPPAPRGDKQRGFPVGKKARLDPNSGGKEFWGVAFGVFNEAGLLRHFGIDDARALRFFQRLYASYDDSADVPFHCALHVQQVRNRVCAKTRVNCSRVPVSDTALVFRGRALGSRDNYCQRE
jgi:hypothetical protein